jgi:anti-sigma factor RsiW
LIVVISDNQHWQKLNAYVDGELEPAEAAEVAAQVATDRRVAAAVATLARLKATTAATAGEPAPAGMLVARSSLCWRWAAAAAVTLFVAAGAWVLFATGQPDSRAVALIERHAAWAGQEENEAIDSSTAARVLVGLGRLGVTAEIPDLTDAGLQLARVSVFDRPGGPGGLHIGYVGTRGCRVSLIIERAAPAQAAAYPSASVEMAAWTVDGVVYTLLASGMHKPRFAAIAASAEAATRSRAPLSEPVREALRGQRDASPPCVG